MGVEWSKESERASGGTELMGRQLEKRIDSDLLSEFQIFPSRVTVDLDPTRVRILWAHDLPGDPMYAHLENEGWKRFHRIVFVSYTQARSFVQRYGIPWSKCQVILNAIEPISFEEKPEGPIRLIYTSTPHRGLNVLLASFSVLAEKRDDVVLDVYSSFGLYGWEDRDAPFQELFDALDSHPRVTRHPAVSNEEVRRALRESHVFAYPSTWEETSCLCLMEAMSADLVCVHSSLGALPETAANWTIMYPFTERVEQHAGVFLSALEVAVDVAASRRKSASSQKSYADTFYGWDTRAKQWEAFLKSLLGEPREIPETGGEFIYRAL